MKQKECILFCLAPAHIRIVVAFYNEVKGKYTKITVVARNKNFVKFFEKLKLNVELKLLDKRIISLKDAFFHGKNVRKQFRNDLEDLNIYQGDFDVYFTSLYIGAYGFYFKLLYDKGCTLTLLKSGSINEESKKTTLKDKIRLFIVTRCFNIHYKPIYLGNYLTLRFPIEEFGNSIIDMSKALIPAEYKINPIKGMQGKSVLLFANPYRDKFHTEDDYNKLHVDLVNYLHDMGIKVYMKGHPRISHLNCIEKKVDEILPNYIPSEFLDYSSFDCAIGLNSTALCDLPIDSYSLLKMTSVTDPAVFKYWIDYLARLGRGNIKYIHTFNDLEL